MAEQEPKYELNKELSEQFPSREEVVEALRADPGNLELLQAFLNGRERAVVNSKDALLLTVELAALYQEAGLLSAARDTLRDAIEQAWQEREDDLHEELSKQLAELEK